MKTTKIRIPQTLYDRIYMTRDCYNVSINVIVRTSVRKAIREKQNVAKLLKLFISTFKGSEVCDQYLNLELDDTTPYSGSEIRAILWHRLRNIEIKPPAPIILDEEDSGYVIEEK